LIFMVVFLCSGCSDTKNNSIHWQLPLPAPTDLHRVKGMEELPDWAAHIEGEATLVFLHRNTAQISEVSILKGEGVGFKDWHVRVLGLAQGLRVQSGSLLNDLTVHNAASFVELSQGGIVMYRGWMYQEFPELFGLDNSNWKVWLKGVTFRETEQGVVK